MEGIRVESGYGAGYWDMHKACSHHRESFTAPVSLTETKEVIRSGEAYACKENLLEMFGYCRAKSLTYIAKEKTQERDEFKEEGHKTVDFTKEESRTGTEVIVRPDGSRVLVMTVSIGGTSTTMSMKISEPTELPNEVGQVDEMASETMESDVCLPED